MHMMPVSPQLKIVLMLELNLVKKAECIMSIVKEVQKSRHQVIASLRILADP